MDTVVVNYVAVVVAAVAAMVLGFIWYSMPVFGRTWLKEIGKTEEDIKDGPGMGYLWTTIAALFTAYVMSHFVDYADAVTYGEGAIVGLWAGLGFVATAMLSESIFAGRSMKLWMITAGYQVVNLVIMGAILAYWQ